jgi:hypothetical protein
MPKKHDPKKREKKEERGSHVSKNKRGDESRERTNALRSKPYPSIHPIIHLHLLIEIA